MRRAELKEYPVVVYDPEVVRGGAELLQGTTEDDWANAWMPIADGYNADAVRHEARGERELAMEDYLTAYRYYTLGGGRHRRRQGNANPTIDPWRRSLRGIGSPSYRQRFSSIR